MSQSERMTSSPYQLGLEDPFHLVHPEVSHLVDQCHPLDPGCPEGLIDPDSQHHPEKQHDQSIRYDSGLLTLGPAGPMAPA